MKKNLFVRIALAGLTVFVIAGCGRNKTPSWPTHYPTTLNFSSDQVWWRPNKEEFKISQVYELFHESYDIIALNYEVIEPIGHGSIKNGKLSLFVDEPKAGELVDWDDMKDFFVLTSELGEGWDNVSISPTGTKCNAILISNSFTLPTLPIVALIREGFSGTGGSLIIDDVFFFYFDRNCTITGQLKEAPDWTFKAFSLQVYKGWNTLCMTQTFTTSGHTTVEMSIKHPDVRWVIYPTPAYP